jgi:hypothetical protein
MTWAGQCLSAGSPATSGSYPRTAGLAAERKRHASLHGVPSVQRDRELKPMDPGTLQEAVRLTDLDPHLAAITEAELCHVLQHCADWAADAAGFPVDERAAHP